MQTKKIEKSVDKKMGNFFPEPMLVSYGNCNKVHIAD